MHVMLIQNRQGPFVADIALKLLLMAQPSVSFHQYSTTKKRFLQNSNSMHGKVFNMYSEVERTGIPSTKGQTGYFVLDML
jgi:hypothetical protein